MQFPKPVKREKPKYKQRVRVRTDLVCPVCSKSFSVPHYRTLAGQRACSRRCGDQLRARRVPRICQQCHIEFTICPAQLGRGGVFSGTGKYCSRKCKCQAALLKPGKNPTKNQRKPDLDWTRTIKARDNYTCQRCGHSDRTLHAHHIAPRARRPDLRYALTNGITLCHSCHSWVHMNPIEAKAVGLLSGEAYELQRKPLTGEETGQAKLTPDQVRTMRMRYVQGASSRLLAEEYGICKSTAWLLLNRKTYKHVA